MRRRVAVTGLGIVSCLGHEIASVVEALKAGRSGVRAAPDWGRHGLKSRVAGLIEDLDDKKQASGISKKLLPGMSDAALFSSLAALDAAADAGLGEGDLQSSGTACFVGSGVGSVETVHQAANLYFEGKIRRVDPYAVLRSMSSSCSAAVSNLLKIRGRSYSLSSACATSAHNIGHAFELIRGGAIDLAIAGGGEDVNELIAASFTALRIALSTKYNQTPTRASRPYDTERDGFVLSGGGGIVVLEDLERARARGAGIRAEILGFGANSDGYDLVLPEPQGVQAAACMRAAIDDAGIAPETVEYVNTHGTSTVQGDIAEIEAMRRVFPEGVPAFSSTKSMTGHAMGAAGAHELIFCVGMLQDGFLAPSINVESPDPGVEGLPLVTERRDQTLTTVMSNNFGFGGTNAAIVLGRYDA